MRVLIFVAAVIGIVYGQCNSSNCKLPNCRCFSDNGIPGGLPAAEVPQMVVITMDYSLNSDFSELYDLLFQYKNPNDCPSTGTFFIQDLNTDYNIVRSFYNRKFEIGISSVDGSIPTDQNGWINMIKSVKDKITNVGVNSKDVKGYRAPQLSFGGTPEFIGIGDNDMLYDAGCITSLYDSENTFKWPYTYDFVPGASCNGQSAPVDLKFIGKWQVLIPDFKFGGTRCEVPQACTNVITKKDAFDILYDNFVVHYEGNRTPYYVIIDAAWMKTDYKREATVEFVEYIRAAFPDTYLVSVIQSLQWVQQPTPIANITSFPPWSC